MSCYDDEPRAPVAYDSKKEKNVQPTYSPKDWESKEHKSRRKMIKACKNAWSGFFVVKVERNIEYYKEEQMIAWCKERTKHFATDGERRRWYFEDRNLGLTFKLIWNGGNYD